MCAEMNDDKMRLFVFLVGLGLAISGISYFRAYYRLTVKNE